MAACDECRALLNGEAEDKEQVTRVESAFPACACENFTLGQGSPGPVEKTEILYRLIVSPASVDWTTKKLVSESTFSKVSENGLSVFRECASAQDIENLIIDRLTRKAEQKFKTIQALARIAVSEIHEISDIGVSGRVFCVYDETVPRRMNTFLPHVPTHATILQRLLSPGKENRNKFGKDGRLKLYQLAEKNLVAVEGFRGTLITDLNRRSADGEFVVTVH